VVAGAASDLLDLTPAGLYCRAADLHIDPTRPVPRAIVTHGHSDHARAGHGAVLATAETLDIMAIRYGEGFTASRQALRYGERIEVGGVGIRLAPAGHVLGSAQIALERGGRTVVVSGDYKTQPDRSCSAFELQRCDAFITEATFGLPVFRHPPAAGEIAKLLRSVALFPERPHLVGAYGLGKAQRLMALMQDGGYDRPVYIHGALARITAYYQARGVDLGDIRPVSSLPKAPPPGTIVICPPSAIGDSWSRRFADGVAAFASGWMRVRARARQRGVELPLIISDHVDWDDLTDTIPATGCEELWITHGEADALTRWAHLMGRSARPLNLLGYGEEEPEAGEAGP
jgi:putative mRNA 3-end processing factor